jgi:hypothetical protein
VAPTEKVAVCVTKTLAGAGWVVIVSVVGATTLRVTVFVLTDPAAFVAVQK